VALADTGILGACTGNRHEFPVVTVGPQRELQHAKGASSHLAIRLNTLSTVQRCPPSPHGELAETHGVRSATRVLWREALVQMIVTVDDHAIVREGLKVLINSHAGMEVVGEAADRRTACARVADRRSRRAPLTRRRYETSLISATVTRPVRFQVSHERPSPDLSLRRACMAVDLSPSTV